MSHTFRILYHGRKSFPTTLYQYEATGNKFRTDLHAKLESSLGRLPSCSRSSIISEIFFRERRLLSARWHSDAYSETLNPSHFSGISRRGDDSGGTKCWKELVRWLPSATPNPRGFLPSVSEARNSREWLGRLNAFNRPPNRPWETTLPTTWLYSIANHCMALFIQDYIGYYTLNVTI